MKLATCNGHVTVYKRRRDQQKHSASVGILVVIDGEFRRAHHNLHCLGAGGVQGGHTKAAD